MKNDKISYMKRMILIVRTSTRYTRASYWLQTDPDHQIFVEEILYLNFISRNKIIGFYEVSKMRLAYNLMRIILSLFKNFIK